ncbi:MAG: four helix bundle protein [Planctomycetota bacterium]|nr:four helix bundle protein [Planctomycetota bacterium]MDI6788268.1 four helix bundle protein [Planctomycetota bacterium]
MNKEDLKKRSFEFALRVIKLVQFLPANQISKILGGQILRSATSIGANIEEAYSGLTRKDFTHSMNISRKEANETKYWLRLIVDSGLIKLERCSELLRENEELIKILTSIVKTLQKGKNHSS